MLCLGADVVLFFPGLISYRSAESRPGSCCAGRCHRAGSTSAAGAGQGPGAGQRRGREASRCSLRSQALHAGGGPGAGASPSPPRARPAGPAPLRRRCARSLSVLRALGRCQRGAPEGGRSAARAVWFRRGSEGGGELWPWGSPSSTGGSRSGTPASARC